ncbi:MAG: RDD family protein [Acidimicrobiia bacterium]
MSLPPPPPPDGTPPPPPPEDWQSSTGYGGSGYRTASGPRAGFWIRFVGALVDGILLGMVNGIIQEATNRWVAAVVGIVIAVVYTTYFIGSPSGQTVGMRAVGIRVIDATGGDRVDYGRCVTRYLVAILSGLAFGLGYFWMLWDPERQTWHDKASGTFVVPVTDYPVERWPG